jgi:hypothetical protein
MWRVFALAAVAGGAFAAAAPAATHKTRPLPVSNLFSERGGHPGVLRSGVTYQANQTFPMGLRFTMTEPGWSGAQWRTGHGPGPAGRKKPPFYGWVSIGAGPRSRPPIGAITIMTAYARTRTVATLVNSLRTRGHGATFGEPSSVTVAGYTGSQFDATITGHDHAFIPFSRTSVAAMYYGDAVYFGKGEHLRVIVLDVRGKKVIVFLENARLPVAQFDAFLTRANRLLQTFKFSR